MAIEKISMSPAQSQPQPEQEAPPSGFMSKLNSAVSNLAASIFQGLLEFSHDRHLAHQSHRCIGSSTKY